MKKVIFLSCLAVILMGMPSPAQSWKQYPYQPENSMLCFPEDEGFHPAESIEWWYINGHLKGAVTGHVYSFMVTYFYEPILMVDGFRIFSLCDETAGIFHTLTRPCYYPVLDTGRLNIHADVVGGAAEVFTTDTSADGRLIPFDYRIEASSGNDALLLHCSAQKPPLIIAGTGLVNQGASGYSYYYSLTDLLVSGTVTFEGITEEITGVAWIDRQFGSFNPYDMEKYEWLNIQLDNHVELNVWNIFTPQNTIPAAPAYRICAVSLADGSSFTTSDFTVQRTKYAYSPDSVQCYANGWHIMINTLQIDLKATARFSDHEIMLPFRFFEGSISVEGTMNGIPVSGQGFAELLHTYEQPLIQLVYPGEGVMLDPQKSLQWENLNPDEGNPLQFDIEISNDKELTFNKIIQDIQSASLYWNPAYFYPDTVLSLRVTGYSADSSLSAQLTHEMTVMPMDLEYEACAEGQASFCISLHDPELQFQWLKDGLPLPGETDSTIYMAELSPASSGEYRCILNRPPFADTTLAFWLALTDEYTVNENITLCDGDEFLGHRIELPGPLLITDTLSSVWGCDSIIHYQVTVDPCTRLEENHQGNSVNIMADFPLRSIVLQFPDAFTGTLMMADLQGRCIITERLFAARTHKITLPAMKPGIYIIRLSGTIEAAYKLVVSC